MSKNTDCNYVPFKKNYSANTIYIEWQGQGGGHFENYIVKYRNKEGADVFSAQHTSESKILISNLKSSTLYDIKVYIEDTNGDESLCFETEVKTIASIASKLIETADKICNQPIIYRLKPFRITKLSEDILMHEFFSEVDDAEERILLLVGAIRSGKSTMIDAIMNYITDVSYADNFRFKITYEKDATTTVQRTDDIVCYRFRCQEGIKIKFNLTVVDVPGVDDRELQCRNNTHVYKKLISLFNSIEYIDAACLVIPSFCRLTQEQTCIFNNILSIFGNDIDYIVPFITFDDGGEIKALNSLKAAEVPFVEHMTFGFNNSQLFSANEHVEVWNRRHNTMRNLFEKPSAFFKYSIEKTRHVLNSRITLNESLMEANCIQEEIEKRVKLVKNYDERSACQVNTQDSDAEKICINCNLCNQTCVFDCRLAVRFFWYIMIVLEIICSCIWLFCSCYGRCCSHIDMCSCKQAFCFFIKFPHTCLGCSCSCSFAHHEKQYGRYKKTNDSDNFKSIITIEDLASFQIQNNDEKTDIQNDITVLKRKYLANYQNIVETEEYLRKNALKGEQSNACEHIKEYQEELKKQIEILM